MIPNFPHIYLIKHSAQTNWYFRAFDEEHDAAVWTSRKTRAKSFTKKELAEEHIDKYLSTRKGVLIVKEAFNPYAYLLGG